ncbi:MAG: hypothetical protein ACK5ZX_03875 [Bacteroidota bacterium]
MKKAQTVSKAKHDIQSLDYELLREKAMAFAQQFSGNTWTDYNYHDPGVTFLEQLCYAITDLAYRTQFPITDLLYIKNDKDHVKSDNLLFPPAKLFPSSPVIIHDFRKLLIGKIPEIKNCWVDPVKDDAAGYQGLIDILVQSGKELNENEKQELIEKIKSEFNSNRLIGFDINKVVIMTGVKISLRGKIQIDPDVVGELLLAQIFSKINDFLNPEIKFQHPDDLLNNGIDPSIIFQGPSLPFGYISDDELKPSIKGIYLSRVKELIAEVPGVKLVEELILMKNEVRSHENLITFENDEFPILDKNLIQDENAGNYLVILKNNIQYKTDSLTTQQFFNAQMADSLQNYKTPKIATQEIIQGRFTAEEIETYFSIQNELPDIYGLKDSSLPSSATPQRRAQAYQLKAYLTFFEQILANYLSQLVNTKKLFSINSELNQTYFYQVPNDIPQLKNVLKEENIDLYKENLGNINQEIDPYIERRNRILDHLLARFGETFPDDILKKFENLRGLTSKNQIELEMIQAKIRFLKQILPLGYTRGLGFNYQIPSWDTQNNAGLANKLSLLLNIKNPGTRSFVKPLLQKANIQKNDSLKNEWIIDTLILDNNEKLEVLRLKDGAYEPDKVSFYSIQSNIIHDLFLHGISSPFYKIVRTGQYPSYLFHLIYKSPQSITASVIFESTDESACLEKLTQAIQRFIILNQACEGFHLIEHILLRPLESVHYTLHFFDIKGEIYIVGNTMNSMVKLKNQVEDFPFIGVKKENYGLIEIEQNSKYQVVIYNNKNEIIGKIQKEFYSTFVAEKEMEVAIQFFQELIDGQRELESSFEIIQQSSPATMFPLAFEFSNAGSLIFPKWPARFQNDDFKSLLKEMVDHLIPAHFNFKIFFIDIEKMSLFETVYQKWLEEKQKPKPDFNSLDNLSLQIVQLILSYE